MRIILGILILISIVGCTRQRSLAKFELKGGFVCEISEDKDYEIHVPVSARVTRGGNEIVPRTFLTGYSPDMHPQFDLLSSSDGQVVGVVEKHEPKKILMLFDTKSLATWPQSGDTELPPSRDQRGAQLLAVLSTSLGDRSLVLSFQ